MSTARELEAPAYFTADIRRIERALEKGGHTMDLDGAMFILPSAPFDLARAYRGLAQMGAANGWAW